MSIKLCRKENLKKIIFDRFDGNNAEFCRAIGKNANGINLILTNNPSHQRTMGESLAREIESILHLPIGFFDRGSNDPLKDGVELFIWGLDTMSKTPIGKLELSESFFYSMGISNPNELYIQQKNECIGLVPYGINPNCLVLVDKNQKEPADISRIFHMIHENNSRCLPVRVSKSKYHIEFDETVKNHPQYEDRVYSRSEFFKEYVIRGRVVGKIPMEKL